ncbi:peptidoglycan-associated lipoprotein Pal [Thiomicrorhabdus sp. HH1]|uniref:Peptidoglycan-associated lipoprotein n=2 Tax=Piscirickettsiaceae TaxID=135616 RepID=A0ABS0BY24_9GAMM|nr:peptidoglycan-associated lipoprotein Pal [Thiomicrorhabdus heinhorstiae]
MSLNTIKNLLLVGLMGITLSGCSSLFDGIWDVDKYAYNDPNDPRLVDKEYQDGSELALRSKDGSDTGAMGAGSGAGDDAGAMSAVEAEKAKLLAEIRGKVIHFDFDRSVIYPEEYYIVKNNARYMALEPGAKVTIEGNCDERGTREYNLALGERRALAVKDALVKEGVAPERITLISFGEDKPVNDAHNEAAWAENRRAEFVY